MATTDRNRNDRNRVSTNAIGDAATRIDRHPNAPDPTPEPAALVPVADAPKSVVFTTANDLEIKELMAGFEIAPIFIKLTEGQVIRGTWVRFGSVKSNDDRPDRITGVIGVKELPTVVLKGPDGLLYEFLSAHEIDRQLGFLADKPSGSYEVGVARGPDERAANGRMVTRYMCGTREVVRR